MSGGHVPRNTEATVYVGGLDERVGEPLLRELFVQFAPVSSVFLPRDRVTGAPLGYAFVELPGAADAEYVCGVLAGVRLWGRVLRVSRATAPGAVGAAGALPGAESAAAPAVFDVGAHVFFGNLDPAAVDAALLESVCRRFGSLLPGKAEVRPTAGGRACAVVRFADFGPADAAIAALDGKPLGGRVVRVCYARREGGGPGETHGSAAERLIAERMRAFTSPQ